MTAKELGPLAFCTADSANVLNSRTFLCKPNRKINKPWLSSNVGFLPYADRGLVRQGYLNPKAAFPALLIKALNTHGSKCFNSFVFITNKIFVANPRGMIIILKLIKGRRKIFAAYNAIFAAYVKAI